MAAINFSTFPTLQAVKDAIERNQNTRPRPYLGMSAIGNPCERALWYGFRWATLRMLPASALLAIEDGHRGEDLMAHRLRMVTGVELHTVGPDGKQFGFEAVGGHFRGHMDGAIRGIKESPKRWLVWEHKNVNEKKFSALQQAIVEHGEKEALRHWDEVYYAQAVCYMEMTGMERHFLTCATPGGRDFISVRTNANPAFAKQLFEKAERIIFAAKTPERISTDPAWYQCKWCDHHAICHGTTVPLPNCRTCSHATPTQGGQWQCERHGHGLAYDDQLKGCDAHRYIPILLENFAEPVDGNQADNWVKYCHKETGATFTNGAPPAGFSSAEIHAAEDKGALRDDDETLNMLRNEFGGKIVE